MKPAAFDYAYCETPDEALTLLSEHGDEARVIAGGQSLMAMLNMRLTRPSILVDVAGLSSLRYVKEAAGYVEIGATTTQAELEAWPGLPRNCRSSPPPFPISVTSRRAIAAPSAARSVTPIRAPSCRSVSPLWGATWCCSRVVKSA